MKKIYVLLCLLFFITAKSQIVSGRVVDSNNKLLENVLIKNIANGSHSHTDSFGVFSIENTKVNDSIEISLNSYETQTIKVSIETDLLITLAKKSFQLDEVVIVNGLKPLNTLSKVDLEIQPVRTSQELLRKVPGLFIGQHAGGGKAEQIFLRGFDIDHGTDINISVDGMPVNMVSHAHGQGYADLHFLIPETVNKIDFDKGSYFVDKGDFTTAGYVAFETKDALENNTIAAETGQFNTLRALGMFNVLNDDKQSAYVSGEYMITDNYFDVPQNFLRVNLFGKYTSKLSNNDKISISLSHFSSVWDASGQIPERAVASGLISHFGAIDATEGGNTSRSNFNFHYDKNISDHLTIRNNAYVSKYDFELYSNFTFFLNDPVNGDQIRQKENRTLIGFESELMNKVSNSFSYKAGIGLRNDVNKDVELSHTVNRQTTLERLKLGDVYQNNFFSYAGFDYLLGKWLINAGLRLDYFKFNYVDKLAAAYSNVGETKAILSPKLNFLYSQNQSLNYYLKLGKGFHSNDTRVVVAQEGKEILPSAYTADLGLIWKPTSKIIINTALWYLHLSQEFVYVGDEAIVEPSGKTERKGFDLGLRYQINRWLFWNSDFTYTHARALEEPKGENYLPLAPVATFVSGINVNNLSGFSGSLRSRYLGDRPANEDNSVIAKGYFIHDFSVNYQFKKVSIGINIDNIFNTKWKETQFLTESRLQNETSVVEEIHYTAGTPFNARLLLKYNF